MMVEGREGGGHKNGSCPNIKIVWTTTPGMHWSCQAWRNPPLHMYALNIRSNNWQRGNRMFGLD